MNISQLVQASSFANSSSLGNLSSGQSGAAQTSQTGKSSNTTSTVLDKANSRLQSQLDATTAQLSSLARLKLAASEIQTAAKAMAATSATTSVANVRAAASNLADSFNVAVITAMNATTVAGAGPSDISSARRVTRDLGSAIASNSALADGMKKLGFKLESNGSLSVDAKKFDAAQAANPAAVQSTLAKLALQLDKAAGNVLSADSQVSGSIASLSQRSTVLKSQQTAMQAMVKQLATGQSAAGAGSASYGLAAYLRASGG